MDSVITVELLKEHLSLEGIDVSNDLLETYIKSAEGYCYAFVEKTDTYTSENVPAQFKTAVLMLSAHFFNNREATTENAKQELMFGIRNLLNSCRDKISV